MFLQYTERSRGEIGLSLLFGHSTSKRSITWAFSSSDTGPFRDVGIASLAVGA